MPRTSPIITNFTAGELTPKLAARVDVAKYQNGCRTLQNMVVRIHGGVQRRPGTEFIAECKT